ncbi:hypothetical protein BSKO_13070 [Bryopsis sp. KO-2023]|nr:hypothetical protein BSKO_13070 [Bryopsis sp. KO-2023]
MLSAMVQQPQPEIWLGAPVAGGNEDIRAMIAEQISPGAPIGDGNEDIRALIADQNTSDVRGIISGEQGRVRKLDDHQPRRSVRWGQSTKAPDGSSRLKKSDSVGLLDRFRRVQGENFALKDLFGHLHQFAKDRNGSRLLQILFLKATKQLFEFGTAAQRARLGKWMEGHVLALTVHQYGCRVVQKAMDCLENTTIERLMKELQGSVFECAKDSNGNHVVQKCIQCLNPTKIEFIFQGVVDKAAVLKTHQHGCRVLQRIMERCSKPEYKAKIAAATMNNIVRLAKHQYGNYIVQDVIQRGTAKQRACAVKCLIPHASKLSKHKFASNVIEKCLLFGAPKEKKKLMDAVSGSGGGSNAVEKTKKMRHELVIY